MGGGPAGPPLTSEAAPPELPPTVDPPVERPAGPPGASIFNLDRPAAGLYAAAWFFALVAVGLTVIGILTESAIARGFLILGAFAALGLCFGAAGGYQVVARSARPAGTYRGPSPLIAFGFALALSSLLAVVLDLLPVLAPTSAPGFLVAILVVFVGYVVTLTFLVVRTRALDWRALARLAPGPGRRVVDFAVGAISGLLVVLPLALLGGLLASALDVSSSGRFPEVSTGLAGLLVAVGAVLVAPVGEELFFRGFALSAWWADLGAASALRRSAVFFAFIHVFNATGTTFRDAAGGALIQFVVIFPLALLLGVLYERRGLAASVGAHMAYNAGVLALALLAGGLLGS